MERLPRLDAVEREQKTVGGVSSSSAWGAGGREDGDAQRPALLEGKGTAVLQDAGQLQGVFSQQPPPLRHSVTSDRFFQRGLRCQQEADVEHLIQMFQSLVFGSDGGFQLRCPDRDKTSNTSRLVLY